MSAAMAAEPLSNIAEFTVSELSFAIKRTMEDAFGLVRLRGEISGYRGPHGSGHAYLCLKDDRAKIDGVIWRQTLSGLRFKPEEGLEVIVTGRITTFPGKSSYQIVIEQLEPAGAGALMALLEERKKKFAAEGLFDEARKRPLPFWPQSIGIVTSPTGAVIRDMLHGFAERCPSHVIVWPVRVQGDTCAAEVAAAIAGFNALKAGGAVRRPELIIVARGGGSLEDLWGFNEEAVVRAVVASTIPVISAVGHETDWTLIDLAADARAPTPTKAAEWAVPKHADLTLRLTECMSRARRCTRRHLERFRSEFRGSARGLPRPTALLGQPLQRADAAGLALSQSLRHFVHRARARSDRTVVRLTPRLVSRQSERAGERLNASAHLSAKAFAGVAARKRLRLQDRSARLIPQLLNTPAMRFRTGLTTLQSRHGQAQSNGLSRKRARVAATVQLLRALSHKSVLERGFAVVRSGARGIVGRKSVLGRGFQTLEIEFADGCISAQYSDRGDSNRGKDAVVRHYATALNRSGAVKKDDGGQGSLL